MKVKVVIIDYGIGNLYSIYKKFKLIGTNVVISSDPKVISNSDKIILPGVGHFKKAMHNLKNAGLIEVLNENVLEKNKPILGICLGMQLMTSFSEEGNENGLGWIDCKVSSFKVKDSIRYKIPHTGWNRIKIKDPAKLISNNLSFFMKRKINKFEFSGEKSSANPFSINVNIQDLTSLGFEARVSFEEGVKIYCEWFANLYIDNKN